MPFIVSLFKYVILAMCFVALMAIGLCVIAVADPTSPAAGVMTPYAIAGAIIFIIFLILNLGGIAILISLHDRHREIAEGIDRIARALEHADRTQA